MAAFSAISVASLLLLRPFCGPAIRHQLGDEVCRAAVIVAGQDRDPGLALDQRGDLHRALGALQNHQIAFPISKFFARLHIVRAFIDEPTRLKNLGSEASGKARLLFLASARQIPCQLFGMSFGAVDVSIDPLVTDPHWLIVKAKATRDLFWRPADF